MPRDLRAKLYGYYRSTAAVRIALGLKGLNVSHEFIHLPNGQQISTDYLAISSYHTGSREISISLNRSPLSSIMNRRIPIRPFCRVVRLLARSFAKLLWRYAATFIQSAICEYCVNTLGHSPKARFVVRTRSTVASTIVGNDAKAFLEEQQKLVIPLVCRERPPMVKNDWLPSTPIFEKDFGPIVCFDFTYDRSPNCGETGAALSLV
ncbi:hypothetical protein SAMN05443247_00854 [Bradyrhizobium erythrophlei]|nr:hypothetical protein SAMN05443247_00854 [Bradyrhizobium erythrophlei]